MSETYGFIYIGFVGVPELNYGVNIDEKNRIKAEKPIKSTFEILAK